MKSVSPSPLPVRRRLDLALFSTLAAAALLLASVVLPDSVFGAQPPPPPAKGFDAFRLVRSLNIFDPERRPMYHPSGAPTYTTRPSFGNSSRSHGDFFALTGTMITDGRRLAFFTGSQMEFNKVISAHDKIAGYTITEVSSTHVDLQIEGKQPLVLVVGKQLALDGSGIKAYEPEPPPPPVEATPDVPAAAPAEGPSDNSSEPPAETSPAPRGPSSSRTAPAAAPASAPASGDKADLIRRMMERAAKERQ